MAYPLSAVSLAVVSIVLFFGLLGQSVFLYIFPGPAEGVFAQRWWASVATSIGFLVGSIWYLSISQHVEYVVRSAGFRTRRTPGMSLGAVAGLVLFGAFFGMVMEETFGLRQTLLQVEDGRQRQPLSDLTANLTRDSPASEDYSTLAGHIYRTAYLEGIRALRPKDGYYVAAPFQNFPLGDVVYTSARTYGIGRHHLTEPQVNSTQGVVLKGEETRRGTRVEATCTNRTANWFLPATEHRITKVSHPEGDRRSKESWSYWWFSKPGYSGVASQPVVLQRTHLPMSSRCPIVDMSVATGGTGRKDGLPLRTNVLFVQTGAPEGSRYRDATGQVMEFQALECSYKAFETEVELVYSTSNPRGRIGKLSTRGKDDEELPKDMPVMRDAVVEVQTALRGWDPDARVWPDWKFGYGGTSRWAVNGPLADGLNDAFSALWRDKGMEVLIAKGWDGEKPESVRLLEQGYAREDVDVAGLVAGILETAVEAYFSIRRSNLMRSNEEVRTPLRRTRWMETLAVGGQGIGSLLVIAFMTVGAVVNAALLLSRVYSKNAAVGLDEMYAGIGRKIEAISPGAVWRSLDGRFRAGWVTVRSCCEGGDEVDEDEDEDEDEDGEGVGLLENSANVNGEEREDGEEPDYTLPQYQGIARQPPSYEEAVGTGGRPLPPVPMTELGW